MVFFFELSGVVDLVVFVNGLCFFICVVSFGVVESLVELFSKMSYVELMFEE